MRAVRSLVAAMLVGSVLAACGGAAATKTPGVDGGGGGGGATDVPAATSGGGGGGGGGGSGATGSVHIELTGPISKSGDYDFVPAGSIFGGTQGSSLNFTDANAVAVVSILSSADGTVVVSYGSPDFSVPGATCTTSNWNMGTSSGSGSFDCDAPLIITAAGAQLTGGKIKGSFTAHA